jgi:hypothetical protein
VRALTPELGTVSQKLRKLNAAPIRNFRLLFRSNALLRICYELIANYAEFADMKSFAQAAGESFTFPHCRAALLRP